ncbi:MAG: hypothetical protein KJ601_08300 [Nanoarchaeota archaeon]|nr:hypothetical protein [Nanoarchaeota archaeon]MBU1703943.1 hypothetical protein [Nanoarchaeota archaeon]
MESKELRQKLIEIFGQQIIFNKEFDSYASRLKEGMLSDLVEWCINCKEQRVDGSQPKREEYRHLFVFFRKIGSNVRATLIKVKNSDFIEIRLENHKCYDDTRIEFGYKKSSYYAS